MAVPGPHKLEGGHELQLLHWWNLVGSFSNQECAITDLNMMG